MLKKVSRNDERMRRHVRVRTKISGTPECPRLNVFRSNSNIHAQIDPSDVQSARWSSRFLRMRIPGYCVPLSESPSAAWDSIQASSSRPFCC